jgi:diaminohydroxyphosphoribosylaminopyrimidine deaminase/5-amino-6-(5-phosphoribosylamino)uracil reductase
MDAIIVGAGTAQKDDPLLTTRPPGPRTATRIVVDSQARLSLTSQLVRTVSEAPLLVATQSDAPAENVRQLTQHGAEVLQLPSSHAGGVDLDGLLVELGRRQFTHVLFEGGSRLFGSLFDGGDVDEVHVFIAPKIVGGADAPSAVASRGFASIDSASTFESVRVERIGDDVYITGRRRSV